MKKYISLDKEKREQLETEFDVCRTTVWAALTFVTKKGKSSLIREAAIMAGGILVDPDNLNQQFDTYFTESPKQMVQVFSPRVRIVADLEKGGTNIEVDDKVAKSFGNVLMSEFYLVQAEAQEIVNNLKL